MSVSFSSLLRPKADQKNLMIQKLAQAFVNQFQLNLTEDLVQRYLVMSRFFAQGKGFLINIIAKREKKDEWFEKIRSLLNLTDQDIKFLNLLIDRGKFFYISEICKNVALISAKVRKEKIFVVSTSHDLDQNAKELILEFISKQIDFVPRVIFCVDQSLISGIKIESDCFLYEKSIKSRLRKAFITLRLIAK